MKQLHPLVFIALLASSASAASPPPPPGLEAALAPLHAQYDPQEHMLKVPLRSPGYHTTITTGMVHPTRDALHYAVGCLVTGDPALVRRACDIIDRVVRLQDQEPASKTYGIWSWFLEEPLDKMRPPDWNWADFCGHDLLQVRLRHWDKIPAGLQKTIDASIVHAANSIRKRNVGPGYTNIAVLGSYVTLVAAETFDLADLKGYALGRLANIRDYTNKTGGFTEYNSPTYTLVTLTALGQIRHDAKDARAREIADELYRLAWKEFATHFHAPTRQWAGPHSRCYSTLLKPSALALVQRGTDGRIDFGQANAPASLESLATPLPCPRDLEPLFKSLHQPREFRQTFVQSADNPIVGTTFLHPRFCLGTVNRCDTWNQRRAIVAYWGDAASPAYLHVRLMRDGYDFAAGQIFTAQSGGRALAAINFATDGGNTHVNLNRMKDGSFTARELKLRFELGGSAASARPIVPASPTDSAALKIGDIHLALAVPFTAFGDLKPQWQSGNNDKTAWLDLVLYSGSERQFDLRSIDRAALGLMVAIGTEPMEIKTHAVSADNGRLHLKWQGLHVSIPMKPAKIGELQKASTAGLTENR